MYRPGRGAAAAASGRRGHSPRQNPIRNAERDVGAGGPGGVLATAATWPPPSSRRRSPTIRDRAPAVPSAEPAQAVSPDGAVRRRQPASREARNRRAALRRRHQWWRGAACPLYRRAPGPAHGGRGRHDLRARLCHVAQRAARPGSRQINGVSVRRFPVRHERNPREFGRYSERVFRRSRIRSPTRSAGSAAKDLPVRSSIDHLTRAPADYVVVFSYRYYHAWHAARRLAHRTVLVPTAERDPAIALQIFGPVFRGRARRSCTTRTKSARSSRPPPAMRTSPASSSGVGSDVPSRH
jgi:hypothetical protein